VTELRHRMLENSSGATSLPSPVRCKRGDAARGRRRAQAPRSRGRFLKRPAHLGTDLATSASGDAVLFRGLLNERLQHQSLVTPESQCLGCLTPDVIWSRITPLLCSSRQKEHSHGLCTFIPPRVPGSVLYNYVAALQMQVLPLSSSSQISPSYTIT
jgi:hypothetical protein